uniref:Uncharacterized protein n=2 Tax=Clastoptera arizonana TaxID=38151 RepID=A0A1B6DEZ3_9HEMI
MNNFRIVFLFLALDVIISVVPRARRGWRVRRRFNSSGGKIFYNEEDALAEFRNLTYTVLNYNLQNFTRDYEACFDLPLVPFEKLEYVIRRPFIVIEGHPVGKVERIARCFASSLGAYYMNQKPPACLRHYKKTMYRLQGTVQKAYWFLSLFIKSYHANLKVARGVPVVVHGYWTNYILNEINYRRITVKDLPDASDKVYKMPNNLMKPDLIFYLTNPPPLNKTELRYTLFGTSKRRIILSRLGVWSLFIKDLLDCVKETTALLRKEMFRQLGGVCDLSTFYLFGNKKDNGAKTPSFMKF